MGGNGNPTPVSGGDEDSTSQCNTAIYSKMHHTVTARQYYFEIKQMQSQSERPVNNEKFNGSIDDVIKSPRCQRSIEQGVTAFGVYGTVNIWTHGRHVVAVEGTK